MQTENGYGNANVKMSSAISLLFMKKNVSRF